MASTGGSRLCTDLVIFFLQKHIYIYSKLERHHVAGSDIIMETRSDLPRVNINGRAPASPRFDALKPQGFVLIGKEAPADKR